MTTIGTAVLQIIPSLRGVSEEIEKQIDGKVVEVKIAPKVDQAASKKAGKDAGEAIVKEAKDVVSKGEIGKAVADDLKTSVKKAGAGAEIAKVVTEDVKKSSPGRDIAKVIVEGLADGVKQGLPAGSFGGAIVDGLTDQVNKGIDSSGLGTQVVGSISKALKSGNLAGAIKDAVLPGITDIGTNIRAGASQWSHNIADALRSGDIRGATSEIANSVTNATNTIAGIGDVLGVKTDGVKTWGDDFAAAVKKVGDTAADTHTQVDGVITPLKSFGDLAGPDSKLYKTTSKLPLIGQLVELVPVARDANSQLEAIVTKYTGLNVPLSGESWLRFLMKSDVNDALNKKLADAQAAAAANAAPVQRGNAVPGDTYRGPGRAAGGVVDPSGRISGPGSGTSDSILAAVMGGDGGMIRVSNRESINTEASTARNWPVIAAGNAGADLTPWFKTLPGFAGGGLVAGDQQLRQIIMDRFGISDIGGYRPADKYGEHSTGRALDVMIGNNKSKGDAVKDFALANASAIDLKWAIWRQHLYYPGGGGYDMPDRGSPTQNHMDHVHIFSGTGIVNGLRGALAGGAGKSGVGAPAAAAVGGPGAEDTSSSDQSAASSTGGAGPLPSSISGLSSFGLTGLGTGVGTTNQGSDLSKFGNAAGSAVTGQVSSALGVLGVNDSPGWLKAASMLVGGLKVGGHDPSGVSDGSIFNGANPLGSFGSGSAAPLSATSASTGTLPPDTAGNAHGTRAGQKPGDTYNVFARDAEDALHRLQRLQKERAAAKLDRF